MSSFMIDIEPPPATENVLDANDGSPKSPRRSATFHFSDVRKLSVMNVIETNAGLDAFYQKLTI